jgi:hypothetical protein
MRGCPWPAILHPKYQGRVAVPIPSKSRYLPAWVTRVQAQYRQFKKFVRWYHTSGGKNELLASDAEVMAIPRYHYDASLLFRRMILLQIDRRELARDEPLLLRELQGLCTLCGSKPECLRGLQREYETGEPQDWHEYCPNTATLHALGALQNCPRSRLAEEAGPTTSSAGG